MTAETITHETAAAAEAHIRRIVGPTILLGDGSYFDYDDPAATTMTIDDYAWGLCTPRFRGQTRTRVGNQRCLYFVVQHCCLIAEQLRAWGHGRENAFAGLMHESDEVVWGDPPGPIKGRFPKLKADLKRWGTAIDQHFGVTCPHPDLIKKFDLMMLSTEKRDLMPQGAQDIWPVEGRYAAFDEEIIPWPAEVAVARFLDLFHELKP